MTISWHTGKPTSGGYYLVTISNNDGSHYVTSELWFNPDSLAAEGGRGGWWASRGYLESYYQLPRPHRPVPFVIAWAPMPEPFKPQGR